MAVFKNSKSCGVSDQPGMISGSNGSDSLDVKKYVTALETFVTKCPTPMSIALQGDWGTGKTTFLQSMEQDLKDKVTCIYFNTWQYSQFNMSGELYFSFITNIVKKLSQGTNMVKVTNLTNKLTGFLKTLSKQIVKNAVANRTGLDVTAFLESDEGEERASSIDKLKKDFEELVDVVIREKKKDRVVIFVDDLDRLDPEIAVELLEVMKLFMDVKSCVYVLAIDYEVVVNGVRAKFGSGMTEEKCRSFFDKIIQLPFRMPVESYNISKLLKDLLPSEDVEDFKDEEILNVLERMVKATIGPNPRTLKRLINSFTLLRIVNNVVNEDGKEKKEEKAARYYYSLLLLILMVQMYDQDVYAEMVSNLGDGDLSLKEYIEQESKEDAGSEESRTAYTMRCLRTALESLAGLAEKKKEKTSLENIYDLMQNAMTLSSITSLSRAVDESVRNIAKGSDLNGLVIKAVEIDGKRMAIKGTQKEAFEQTISWLFEWILASGEVTEERFDRLVEETNALTYDPNGGEQSTFESKASIKLKGLSGHDTVTLATHMSGRNKGEVIRSICEQLGLKHNLVIWHGTKKGEEQSHLIW